MAEFNLFMAALLEFFDHNLFIAFWPLSVSGAGVVLLPNPCGATKQSGKSSNFTIEYSKSVPLTYPTRLVAIRLFR